MTDPTPRWAVGLSGAGLALACFAQAPGRIVADTKLDMAVNPLGFLGRALHLWNPEAGFGQLQNQAQGYLFPMGPFFALGRELGVPAWFVQRAWVGLLLACACAGAVRLADALDVGSPPTRVAGGLAYALSPSLLALAGPLSGVLLPAALAPWAVVPLVHGCRRGSPAVAAARSGAAVACMGGVNAGATVAVLAVPALWLATRRGGARRRSLVRWWLLCVALATAWWLGAAAVEARFGFAFLRHIERAASTTATASLPQALRGTANWLGHYVVQGRPWWQGAWLMVAAPAAIMASAALAAGGLAGLARRGHPERRFLVLCLLAGLALTAAAYAGPLGGPLAGSVQWLLDGPLVAFRSINKFHPLVALPLALGLAHALSGLRLSPRERPAAIAVLVLALLGTALPLVQGRLFPAGSFRRLPPYWKETADWLAARSEGSRSLLLPASGFGEYRWGRPMDEPLQALAGAPWAVRDQAPLGSPGVVRLLDAVEDRLASGRPVPGLAPALARAGVRHLVVRNDLDWPRAGAPSPDRLEAVLRATPGIRPVAGFGPRPTPPATAATGPAPSHAVDVYEVDRPVARAVAYPAEGAAVVSGGPEGALQVADRGGLDGAAVVAGDPVAGLGPGLRWAVTDGLRRRDVDFGLVHGAASYVLERSEPGRHGAPRDRLPVEGVHRQTVAVMEGATSVRASSYATAVKPHPEAQPWAAFDRDPDTAWQSGAPMSSEGEWVEIGLERPASFPHVVVRLYGAGPAGPRATRLRLTTDAGTLETRVGPGEEPQILPLPAGPTARLRVTLAGVVGEDPGASFARAGLREVELPGLTPTRLLAVPADEAARFAAPGSPAPLYAFDRAVRDPALSVREDEESRLARRFTVPRAGSFRLSGTVRAGPRDAGSGTGGGRACGEGPTVMIDGMAQPTALHGDRGPSESLEEVPFSACGPPLALAAGPHRLETEAGTALPVVSVTVAGEGWEERAGRATAPEVRTRRWDPTHRVVRLGPGPASVLALGEGFNRGWSARLGGRQLRPVRLDGWRQGWLVPAGRGGTVEARYTPDRAYRAALGLGAMGLVLLAVLASGRVLRGRGRDLEPAAEGGQPLATTVAGTAALFLVGGPVALVVPAALVVLRRQAWAPVLAATAFLAAGLVEALEPARGPGSGEGAFGWPAQLAALVAVGAVAASVLWPGTGERSGRPGVAGPGQEDGGHAGPPGQEAVQAPGGPGDVVVAGAGQGHVLEAVGPQQLDQGPGGEQAQVADDLVAGAAEDPDAADL